jgi:chemotaxis protein methyltransferase CheR
MIDLLTAQRELELTDVELARIARLVYERSGIALHEGKRPLVIARLFKRLRQHGLTSFTDYMNLVERDRTGGELVLLLDAIATNHTYFFREEQHFAFLASRVVNEWRARRPAAPLRIWSAACSTGEEPYSIAMALADLAPAVEFTVLGSDISTKVIAAAQAGVYKLSSADTLTRDVRRRHFERCAEQGEEFGRISADIRRRVTFRNLNLLQVIDLGERFDAVFCRNVMIYFDKSVQQRVVSMLERHVKPGGYLVISHSESLNGLTHSMRPVAPAVYTRLA